MLLPFLLLLLLLLLLSVILLLLLLLSPSLTPSFLPSSLPSPPTPTHSVILRARGAHRPQGVHGRAKNDGIAWHNTIII